jgi:hypothetical protein
MSSLAAALLAEPDEIRRLARAAAERSATAQGLPQRIVDRAALQRVAALLRPPAGVAPAPTKPARPKSVATEQQGP